MGARRRWCGGEPESDRAGSVVQQCVLLYFLAVFPDMTNRRQREYLTQQEINKLLAASKTASRNPQRDYCILLLMFRHGVRVSELCSLKLSDIDLGSKVFHVRRIKGCDHGEHEFYNGETAGIKA